MTLKFVLLSSHLKILGSFYILAHFWRRDCASIKSHDESTAFMVLQARPTPTRFPVNIFECSGCILRQVFDIRVAGTAALTFKALLARRSASELG